jgi:hypothetical protein
MPSHPARRNAFRVMQMSLTRAFSTSTRYLSNLALAVTAGSAKSITKRVIRGVGAIVHSLGFERAR